MRQKVAVHPCELLDRVFHVKQALGPRNQAPPKQTPGDSHHGPSSHNAAMSQVRSDPSSALMCTLKLTAAIRPMWLHVRLPRNRRGEGSGTFHVKHWREEPNQRAYNHQDAS